MQAEGQANRPFTSAADVFDPNRDFVWSLIMLAIDVAFYAVLVYLLDTYLTSLGGAMNYISRRYTVLVNDGPSALYRAILADTVSVEQGPRESQ